VDHLRAARRRGGRLRRRGTGGEARASRERGSSGTASGKKARGGRQRQSTRGSDCFASAWVAPALWLAGGPGGDDEETGRQGAVARARIGRGERAGGWPENGHDT
jgi:hypothetical protein